MQALQIRQVARDVEGEDLPLALVQELVAAGPARQDEAAVRRLVLVTHDVLVRVHDPDGRRQALDGSAFLV